MTTDKIACACSYCLTKTDELLSHIQIQTLIDTFENDLLISAEGDNTYFVTGLTETPYTFLQNIQRFKAHLSSLGLSFQPICRLTEFCFSLKIVRKGV